MNFSLTLQSQSENRLHLQCVKAYFPPLVGTILALQKEEKNYLIDTLTTPEKLIYYGENTNPH